MIKIENTEVFGWEAAIRGMRNPKNSWDRMDSRECIYSCDNCDNFGVCNSNNEEYFKRFWEGYEIEACNFAIGPNDHKLMMNLADGGPVHAKYRRMITVYVDITAPLYWWKEFDTYKVGTVANSCSTMHKIHDKEFTLEDFSCEHLMDDDFINLKHVDPCTPRFFMNITVQMLNHYREKYLEIDKKLKDINPLLDFAKLQNHRKKAWWQMIQLLPSSYNQKRTIMLNYEVLAGIYPMRKGHKLDEWHDFCDWIKSLPYSEIIVGDKEV